MEIFNALSNALAQYMFGAPQHVWMGFLIEAGQLAGIIPR